VASRYRLHLILRRFNGPAQVSGPALQRDSAAVERMEIGELVNQRRRL